MPTRPVPFSEIKHTVKLWHGALDAGWPAETKRGPLSAIGVVVQQLGLSMGSGVNTVRRRLDTASALGIEVREWRPITPTLQEFTLRRYRQYDEEFQQAEAAFGPADIRPGRSSPAPRRTGRRVEEVTQDPPTAVPPPSDRAQVQPPPIDQVVTLLRRGPLTLAQVAERLQIPELVAELILDAAHARGHSVVERGGVWHLDGAPAMGHQRDSDVPTLVSDENGVLRFAAVGDTHLGSKYAREDCLNDFYDNVAHRGLKTVLHAGNWIDGEAVFNRHDLLVHGMDQQMQYLAKNYPQRPGVETWAITGEDHEGWYSRREGIDVGRYAENVMRQNGRTDWRDMGFMENYIDLVHGGTGKSSKLLLMHPGGGSAYAVSYAPQKIVEGFDGGDKPAVLLVGHYHKSSYNLIRNVHTFQVGCFEDQTVFMRKQKLSAHLGGWFIELRMDPETGAVIEGGGFFRNYFVRDYYRGRWSQHGPVNHAPRTAV